ncbi:MAG TPA: hypothetical protein VKB41_09790 [Steroidobacteraceae bacterium]|jgi:hypothetical protein|nr:hypothetical protein [Steroidobacteraceae bacterium]
MTHQSAKAPNLLSSHFNRPYFRGVGVASAMLGAALLLGVAGYHFIAELGWIDALLNAAMILTGMGEIDPLRSDAAKIFASAYALFSGIVFLTAAGAILAPMFHRVLHKFHIEVQG